MVREERKLEGKKVGSIWSLFIHADGVDKWLMALGFIAAVSEGLTDRLQLYFTAHMINSIGNVSKLDVHVLQHNLNKNVMTLLYFACVAFVACFLEGYCWTRTGERQASRMRAKYLKAILRQDLGYFDLNGTSISEVITSISNDSHIIQEAISEKVPDFVSKASTFIGSYMIAFIMVWRLALTAFPMALLMIIPSWLCGRSLLVLAGKIRSEYNTASTIAEQALSSVRTVYAFVGEKKIVTEFTLALNRSIKLGLRQGLIKGMAIGSSSFAYATWAFMAYYGSRLVMYHGAQGGTIYAASMAIVSGGSTLGAALSNLSDLAEACSASKRIMEVIKKTPNIDSENMKGLILENVSGEIEFKDVNFSYPSRLESVVFEKFRLTIPARKTVALVGASGSGKSTILSLLQRFYDPLEGEILLDGVAINKLQIKWLRSQMALVSQEPSLFSTSIKENILFGKEDAEMEDVVKASEASDAHDFISRLPQAYDTQVGERGIKLSGGQKQRIAIARAIIREPRILLLDEATSALDSESERVVQEAINKVAAGRTTVIISHRLSTIKNVDAIVVMENGQVMEVGSHNELVSKEDGLYHLLVRLQQIEKEKNLEEFNCFSFTSSIKTKIDCPLDVSNSDPTNNTIGVRSPISLVGSDDDSETAEIPTSLFRRLLGLSKPECKQMIVGCFSAILSGTFIPLYSIFMGITISAYFSIDHDEMKKQIRISAFALLGLSLIAFLITISQYYAFAYNGEYLTRRIRETMLSRILTFEVGWFDEDGNASSIICSKLAKNANLVKSLVGDKLPLLVKTTSAVTIAWMVGLVIAWKLAIVLIVVQPLLIASFYNKGVLLKNMSRKAIKAQDESTKLASEAVSNLRTITAFSSQSRILRMFEKAQEGPRKQSIRQSLFTGIILGLSLSTKTGSTCLNYWYSGKLVFEGYASPRAVFQTMIVIVITSYVIADVGSFITFFSKGQDAIRSIFLILDRKTKIEPGNLETQQPEKIIGKIELCDVHFAYPTRPNVMIFHGFSIHIEAGKSIAFVGKSGSGKSTIIGLIERFYDPLKGVVKIDGRDIKSYHLRSLRRHIALVNQEPTLFSGTIRENIRFGLSDDIRESEIIEAARAANIHDFVARQNDGYETLCGDRGLQLSGGQKQRIAIARAILRNPTILLLDEATSALDSLSEKVVQEALDYMRIGRTSVVVAHRLSTIKNCDEIVVLDKGDVVEKGTHSTLMAKGPTGAYHSFVSLQTMEFS